MDDIKDLASLTGNKKNPRTMTSVDAASLQRSIEEFGDLSGVVFNVASNQLVGGHQRVEIFKRIQGETHVEITERLAQPDDVGTTAYGYLVWKGKRYAYREVNWPLDTTDPETGELISSKEIAANIAANRIQGDWNRDLLAEWDWFLQQNNPDMLILTGQSNEEISRLLDQYGGAESTLTEEDEAPAADETVAPVSVLGTIYQLGPHRLMCGDSTSGDHVRQLMNGQAADMVFTDPPYNVDYEGGTGMKIQNDSMSDSDFYQFLLAVHQNLIQALKAGGSIYVCHADLEGINFRRSFVDAGFKLSSVIIWNKNSLVLGRGDYQWKHEPILYGWKEGAAHYFIEDRDRTTVWEDLREVTTKFDGEYTSIKVGPYEVRILGQVEGEVHRKDSKTDIWRFDRPSRSEDHPTMKPIALCEEAILNSSLRGGSVLDLFGGSGSTLIAADRQGRNCYMMELDPKYVDVIRKRYAKHIGRENDWEAATPAIQVAPAVTDQTTASPAPIPPEQ